MTKINQLQTKITSIEAEAGSLDPTKDNYYESLYNLLSEAYFATKDIIVLQQDLVPVAEDKASEVALRDELAAAIAKTGRLEQRIAVQDAEILGLEHWKDGASLEYEQHLAKLAEREQYILNMKEQRDKDKQLYKTSLEALELQRIEYRDTLGSIYDLIPSDAK